MLERTFAAPVSISLFKKSIDIIIHLPVSLAVGVALMTVCFGLSMTPFQVDILSYFPDTTNYISTVPSCARRRAARLGARQCAL